MTASRRPASLGGPQAFRDFPADAKHAEERQLGVAMEASVERLPLQQLHGQEGDATFLIDLANAGDVIALDGGHGLRFAHEALAPALAARLRSMALTATERFSRGSSAW